MIQGWIGLPGGGKTYLMTRMAAARYKQYDEVCSNYPIDLPNYRPMRNLAEFLEIADEALRGVVGANGRRRRPPKRRVLLDEVHLWMDSRAWASIPPQTLRVLALPRKGGLDIDYSSQDFSNVEKRLRTVTNWLWDCRDLGKDFNVFQRPYAFQATRYPPNAFRKTGKLRGKKDVLIVARYRGRGAGNLYDTMEILDQEAHVIGKPVGV
jgi:hypothetical protein